MQRKTYQTARAEKLDESLVFEIDGEEFTVYPYRVPGAVAIDVNKISQDSERMWDFFRCAFGEREVVLDKDEKVAKTPDFERFEAFTHTHRVEAETLGQIINDIGEAAFDRPTTPSVP